MVLTRDIKEVEKLFRQMVFNVLIENKDDHAKNFSFIYKNEKWKLSPAYDLLKSSGFNNQHSTTINGKGNPSQADLMQVALKVGIRKVVAESIYDELRTKNDELNQN